MTTEHLEHANVSSSTDKSSSSSDNPPEISSSFMLQCLCQQTTSTAKNTSTTTDYLLRQAKYLRKKAEVLNDFRWVYGLYGLLDGVSTSFSMLKYAFDIHYANGNFSSADMLHDFLLTPEGIVLVVVESVVLAGFAASGNVFDDDAANHTGWKKWSAILWRYVRDALKALKNAYKGIRNLFFLLDMVAVGQNIAYLVLPLGLALGALSAVNRMFIRYMRDERKGKVKINERLLNEIKAKRLDTDLTLKDWERFRQETELQIQGQSIGYRVVSYLAATYSGLLDAPYLYLGAVSLAVLNPTLFVVIATYSVLFVAVCIATRVFEEYNYQRLLFVSQTTLELEVCTAELRLLFSQLEVQLNEPTISPLYEILRSDFEEKLKKAAALKETLRQQSVLSTGSVILGGLRNGMDAYGALASLMFVIATVFLMLSISYPPLLLLAFGSIGMIFLAGFVGLALTTHWQYLKGCGLIKMSVDPETMTADELETLLNKKPAYVLFDAKVYYIDRELKKIELKTKDSEQLEAIFSGHVNELKDASKENLTQITSLTRHIHLTKHSTPLSRADQLTDLLSKLKNQIVIPTEDIQSIKDHIDRLTVVPSPQYFFQEWFEVLRLLCSGGGKGMRSVDETMVAWQDIGDDGHYHDTWIMAAVAWFFAAIFGVSFALRGFARLGRNNKTCAEAAQDAPSSPVSEIASPLDSTSDSSTDSVISNASQNDANAGISPLISIVKNPVNNIPDQNVALSSPRPATPKLGVGAMLTTFFSPKPLTKTNNSSFSGFSSLNRIDSESKSPILVGKVVDSEQDHCTFYIDDTSERSSSAT